MAEFLIRLFPDGIDEPRSRIDPGDITCVFEDNSFNQLPSQDYRLGMLVVKNMTKEEGEEYIKSLHYNQMRIFRSVSRGLESDVLYGKPVKDRQYETVRLFKYQIDFNKLSISDRLKLTRGKKILRMNKTKFKTCLKEKMG